MKYYTDYKKYLRSWTWARLRNQCLENDNFKCLRCWSEDYLTVHHAEYPEHWLWTEDVSVLYTLCEKCHEGFHNRYWTTWLIPDQTLDYVMEHPNSTIPSFIEEEWYCIKCAQRDCKCDEREVICLFCKEYPCICPDEDE